MAKPVVFGPYKFKTKKAATEEIRNRISHYQEGQDLSNDDSDFFKELFKLHSEYLEKRGCGISHITVERDFNRNRCLIIKRIDGSSIDISWVHCLKPLSRKTVVAIAFRRTVKESIKQFKETKIASGAQCPVKNIPLDLKNSHAVYICPTFDELFLTFISEQNVNLELIEINDPVVGDNDQRGIITNNELRNSWIHYHKENACLELWSANANLSRSN
ncbi:DCL family protein [Photobacterium sp. ZSDE20]|nr:DCL family protein [Photobacterium sp. ZSDE20]